MRFEFTKMHALGNDYIIVDGNRFPFLLDKITRYAVTMSDRHFGIGGDGVIFALPSKNSDARMRMFNADGSESEMCGNGIRQLAKFIYEKGIFRKNEMRIETLAGEKLIQLTTDKNGAIDKIVVNMGAPILEPNKIPVYAAMKDGFSKKKIAVLDREFEFTFVSMGNPHAITYVDSVKDFDVEKYGRVVENLTDIFPKKTNVEFIEVLSDNETNMRVWERGSGETLACGTGTCASVVSGVLNGLHSGNVTVHLLGGDLLIEWAGDDNPVMMTGDARIVFEGTADTGYFD